MTTPNLVPRPQTLRNSVHSSLHLRFITLVSRKCSRMRKPDACSLLTSWHLLCPNCPLVLFLFSLSFECPMDIVNFIPRAHSSDANRFRALTYAHILPLSFRSPFIPLFFLLLVLLYLNLDFRCTILTPSFAYKTTRGIPRFYLLVVLSLSKTSGNFAGYLLFYLTFIITI